jgi:HTH-type transcriptional regulator / antitoxin HipB
VRVRSVADVAAAVRGRRMDLKLSQSALAGRTGISRKWISEFESGRPAAEFSFVLRVLEGLGLDLQLDIDSSAAAARPSSSTSDAAQATPLHTHVDLDALLAEYRKG